MLFGFLLKSKQTLRFDRKFELLQFDNFSRENSSFTYLNQNKHCNLAEVIERDIFNDFFDIVYL